MIAAMYSVSTSTPLENLAPERPRKSIISAYMFFSVLSQFLVHVISLVYVLNMALSMSPQATTSLNESMPAQSTPPLEFSAPAAGNTTSSEESVPDGKYVVTLVNTGIYLLNVAMQLSTVFINYNGKPFMIELRDSKYLKRSIIALGVFAALMVSGYSDGLGEFMELAPSPVEFRQKLALCMLGDICAAWAADIFWQKVFRLSTKSSIHQLLSKP